MPTTTLTDVAHRAGVSVPTASRVLRGVTTVDTALKERVEQAATELGYQPNRLARSLRERRTGIVGYMSAGSTANFHTVLAQGIYDAGLEYGYAVVTGMSSTTAREQNYAQIFAGFQVDGLIVVPSSGQDPAIAQIASRLPLVEVDRTADSNSCYRVLLDNHRAMALAVEHLTSLGHRDIALIYGADPVSTELERLEGYQQAMKACGLPLRPELLVADEYWEAGGVRAMNKLLESGVNPTAVVTTTNEMLAGAVLALRERQLRIPEDLSVIGLDDTRWTRLMSPPLTVIAQPAYEMGRKAVELLVTAIENRPNKAPTEFRFAPQLLLRSSTAPPSG